MKKCAACKKEFSPFNSLQKACSPKCALQLTDKNKKEQKKKDKQWIKANKSLQKHIAEAQTAVNRYIRARDKDKPCISCGIGYRGSFNGGSKFDAGHYLSRGAHPNMRFYITQIASQCVTCNRFKSGNHVGFRKGLISKLGVYKVEKIERAAHKPQITKEYCDRVKRVFNKRARWFERRE